MKREGGEGRGVEVDSILLRSFLLMLREVICLEYRMLEPIDELRYQIDDHL